MLSFPTNSFDITSIETLINNEGPYTDFLEDQLRTTILKMVDVQKENQQLREKIEFLEKRDEDHLALRTEHAQLLYEQSDTVETVIHLQNTVDELQENRSNEELAKAAAERERKIKLVRFKMWLGAIIAPGLPSSYFLPPEENPLKPPESTCVCPW